MAKKPRFIKPINNFKMRVGTGGIDEKLLDSAQNIIKENKIDFTRYATEYIQELEQLINQASIDNATDRSTIEKLIKPIMQLKANGGMFKYYLISDIADIALDFLEDITEINEDVLRIINIHKQTLQVIIISKLTGDGGKEGLKLIKELNEACTRYKNKYVE